MLLPRATAVVVAAHLEVINRQEVHLLHPSKHTCMIFSVGVGKEKKPYFFFLLRPASDLRGKSMCRFFLLKEVIRASKKKNPALLSKRA